MYVNVQAANGKPAQRVRIDRKWVNKMSMRFNFAGQYATDSLMVMEDQNIGSDQLLAWIMREMGWEKRLLVSQKMKLAFALRRLNHYLIDHGCACWYRSNREWYRSGDFAKNQQGFLRRVPTYRDAKQEQDEERWRESKREQEEEQYWSQQEDNDPGPSFDYGSDPHGFAGLDRDRSRALSDDMSRCARL